MGLFSRRKISVAIPGVDELNAFGRYCYSPMDASDSLAAAARQTEPNYYGSASSSPVAFCSELLTVAKPHAGWVALGASRLIASLIGGDYDNANFDELRSISLSFLWTQGLAPGHLDGYEIVWWSEHRPPGA